MYSLFHKFSPLASLLCYTSYIIVSDLLTDTFLLYELLFLFLVIKYFRKVKCCTRLNHIETEDVRREFKI